MKWMNLQFYLLLTLGTKITCRMAWVRMTAMTVNTHRLEDYQKSSQPSSSKEIYPVMFAFFPLLLENNESFYENSSDISPICLKISEILPENHARLNTGQLVVLPTSFWFAVVSLLHFSAGFLQQFVVYLPACSRGHRLSVAEL